MHSILLLLACSGAPAPSEPAPPAAPAPKKVSVKTPFTLETDADGNTRLSTGWLDMTCPKGWEAQPRTFTTRYVRCITPAKDGQCVGATEKLRPGTTAAQHSDAAVVFFEANGGPVDTRTDETLQIEGLSLHRTDVTRGEDRVLTFTAVNGEWAGVIACSEKPAPGAARRTDFESIGRSLRLREPQGTETPPATDDPE